VKSFLIVEDDDNIRDLYENLIRKRYGNVHVDQVANGRDALKKVRTLDYTVIIIDLGVPLLNGKEFYEILKKEMPVLAERTVFISGNIYLPEYEFIFEDSRPHLSKPFKPKALYTVLSYTIQREEEEFIARYNTECRRESVRFKGEVGCVLKPYIPGSNLSPCINCKISDYSLDGFSVILEERCISDEKEFLVTIDRYNIRNREAKVVWKNYIDDSLQLGLYWT